jgi:hypothetical protein
MKPMERITVDPEQCVLCLLYFVYDIIRVFMITKKYVAALIIDPENRELIYSPDLRRVSRAFDLFL